MAEVEHAPGLTAIDALEREQIVGGRPVRFIHPLVGTAIYDDLSPATRSLEHDRAARALATAGADVARVASQLIHAEPAGDEWAVQLLRQAARDATPDAAVRWLSRALAEPPRHCAPSARPARARHRRAACGTWGRWDHRVAGGATPGRCIRGRIRSARESSRSPRLGRRAVGRPQLRRSGAGVRAGDRSSRRHRQRARAPDRGARIGGGASRSEHVHAGFGTAGALRPGTAVDTSRTADRGRARDAPPRRSR